MFTPEINGAEATMAATISARAGESMDKSTLIGIGGATLLILVSIVIGGSAMAFVNAPALLITVGGGLTASMAGFPLKSFMDGAKAIKKAFKPDPSLGNPLETIDYLTEVTKRARKDGILALEGDIDDFYAKDPMLGDIMRMLIDGQETEDIAENAENAMAQTDQQLSSEIAVWEALGDLFPAFGMIGTLIGLIQMLQNLSDPAALGPGMAVAMLTTLYGAVLANVLCIPVAKKLKFQKELVMMGKESYLIVSQAIGKGINPNSLRMKLAALHGVEA